MAGGRFQRGNAGRPKGALNKSTKALKEALLQAADDAHPQGVRGWLVELSENDPKAFASLLARLLPTESKVEQTGPTVVLKDFSGGKTPGVSKSETTPPPPKISDRNIEKPPPSKIN